MRIKTVTQITFEVGDRVRTVHHDVHVDWRGKTGTITHEIRDGAFYVQFDDPPPGWGNPHGGEWHAEYLEPEEPLTLTEEEERAIIASLTGGA